MSSFKFEWWRCRDEYRIERRPPVKRAPRKSGEPLRTVASEAIEEAKAGTFIVPNSDNWDYFRPLDVEAPYRAFAKWDGTDAGLLELANAYGSMLTEKAEEEDIEDVRGYVAGIRNLVENIERAEWEAIGRGLKKATKGLLGPRSGIGRLGIEFEVADGKPEFKLRPPTLVDALQAQALFDAAHGIKHKQCRNPECRLWFRVGPGAQRSDAEYHSRDCRFRHAYQMRKESQS